MDERCEGLCLERQPTETMDCHTGAATLNGKRRMGCFGRMKDRELERTMYAEGGLRYLLQILRGNRTVEFYGQRELKHEIALLVRPGKDTEEVSAPDLERTSRHDPGALEARRLKRMSRLKLLRCAVCGSPLTAKLGRKKSWHFAMRNNDSDTQAVCDHEPESLAHRSVKKALYEHFLKILCPLGWRVALEEKLPCGQRPDVLLEAPATRTSVGCSELTTSAIAIEVQFSPIPPEILERRRQGYRDTGVTDLWLIGWRREQPDPTAKSSGGLPFPNALSKELAQAGHRVILVGGGIDEAPWFSEALLAEQEPFVKSGRNVAKPLAPGSRVSLAFERLSKVDPPKALRAPRSFVRTWVPYSLPGLHLSADGQITTPADAAFSDHELSLSRKSLIRSLERVLALKKRRADLDRRVGRPKNLLPQWSRTSSDERVEREPAKRQRHHESRSLDRYIPADRKVVREIERDVGLEWIEFFEREGPYDDGVLASPLRWKYSLARTTLPLKRPGEPFLARDVAQAVIRHWRHSPRSDGRRRAALAVLGFLESLVEQGELVRLPDDGMSRKRFARPSPTGETSESEEHRSHLG